MIVYFYSKTKNDKKNDKYTVYRVEVLKDDLDIAEKRCRIIAIKNKDTLAGGYFNDKCLPYNFKKNYTIIKVSLKTRVLAYTKKERGGKMFNLTDSIIAFECGELRGDKVLELFSQLIKTGQAWTLQGSYGRTAQSLIERGYLSTEGNILKTADTE